MVLYDIVDDDRRERVRRVLGGKADRFQQSGWLVPGYAGLTADEVFAAVTGQAGRGDRIRVYSPCAACARAVRWLPAGQPFTLISGYGEVVG